MSIYKDKTLLITGGTGSFGNAVLDRFLATDIKEIRIFSRDELKQDNMRHFYQREFPEYSEKIKFYIGDVRDLQSVKNVAGKDAYQITNIVKGTEDIVIDSSLAAPTIEYVETVGDEIARLKITYPSVASKSIYSINSESELSYSEEISITQGNTYVTAYYYTSDGHKGRLSDSGELSFDRNGSKQQMAVINLPYISSSNS